MVETQSGEWGPQVLQAIQALGDRMDRMEARMDRMETRLDQMEARLDRMEARMDRMETRLVTLESRMDKQERWMERLGGEFLRARDEMGDQIRHLHGDIRHWRTETQNGLGRLDARVEVTSGVVFMLALELRGPLKMEFSAELGRRLEELKPH